MGGVDRHCAAVEGVEAVGVGERGVVVRVKGNEPALRDRVARAARPVQCAAHEAAHVFARGLLVTGHALILGHGLTGTLDRAQFIEQPVP